jgi:flagellar basal-body rod protein FlgB
MFEKIIFSSESFPLIKKTLKAYSARHRTIADNISNISSPGYSKKKVQFEEHLHHTLNSGTSLKGKTTRSNHIPLGRRDNVKDTRIEVETVKQGNLEGGVNNVDIDMEMANLSVNTIKYNVMVNYLTRKLSLIKDAIRERR